MANIYNGFSTVNNESRTYSLYDLELVKRDILNHLYTRRGERVMLPNFGSSIQDYIMEPFVDEIEDQIEDEVRRVVESDPRVTLNNINVVTQAHLVQIEVQLSYTPGDIAETLYLEFQRRTESIT